jgi:hypothetical protein
MSRVLVLAVLAAVLLGPLTLGGCGAAGERSPSLAALPLARGTRVTTELRSCNHGAAAYCALQLIVQGARYRSAQALVRSESLLLRRRGWRHANAPVGQERAADSPGNRLRVTYATANGELEAVDLGWIKRPRQMTLALSRAIFDHASAMAVVLEIGSDA